MPAGIKISDDVMEGVVFLPVGAWYNPAMMMTHFAFTES